MQFPLGKLSSHSDSEAVGRERTSQRDCSGVRCGQEDRSLSQKRHLLAMRGLKGKPLLPVARTQEQAAREEDTAATCSLPRSLTKGSAAILNKIRARSSPLPPAFPLWASKTLTPPPLPCFSASEASRLPPTATATTPPLLSKLVPPLTGC